MSDETFVEARIVCENLIGPWMFSVNYDLLDFT